jgi:hypothetical protein
MAARGSSARFAAVASLVLTLAGALPGWAAVAADGDTAPQTFTLTDTRKALAVPKPERPLPSARLGQALDSAFLPQVALPAVDRDALLARDEKDRRSGRLKALRYGIGRPVRLGAADGSWYRVEGGYLWVAEVTSPEALGLRLHFAGVRLPAGAELAVYGVAGPAAAPKVERRTGAPGSAQAAGSFWTRTLPGDRARIEVFLPGESRQLPFTVDRLQHLYLDPVTEATSPGSVGNKWVKRVGPCHNDVTCYADWRETANSVGGTGFIGGGDALFCTGQLLNNDRADFTPYFLTAHHCQSTQGEAASTEFYWFYQSATCGGAPPRLDEVPTSAGATLLATGAASDYTLLMVEGALPSGLSWAGWTSAVVPDGVLAAGIHHPDGTYKRISFGQKAPGAACGSSSLLRISWIDGPTEPGSSGSGIFRRDTHQLFGQLFFGPSSCSSVTYDCYGAFSATYPHISGFLSAGADEARAQNKTCARARTVGAGKLAGVARATGDDWYRAEIPAGRTLRVTLDLVHADGDIDLRLLGACGTAPLAVSDSATDREEVTFRNTGAQTATYTWQVFLASDTRNAYTMRVAIE